MKELETGNDPSGAQSRAGEAGANLTVRLAVMVEKWKAECVEIDRETHILRSASVIVGDEILKHSIELWQMKNIRLQRCVIEVQHLMLTANAKIRG